MSCTPNIQGQYCTDCDVYAVWGKTNIAIWSDLSGNNTLDTDRLTYAINWGASQIILEMRADGNYTDPIFFTGTDTQTAAVWNAIYAGMFLYESRGLRDENREGNQMKSLMDKTHAMMLKCRGSLRLSATRRWPQSTSPCGHNPTGI